MLFSIVLYRTVLSCTVLCFVLSSCCTVLSDVLRSTQCLMLCPVSLLGSLQKVDATYLSPHVNMAGEERIREKGRDERNRREKKRRAEHLTLPRPASPCPALPCYALPCPALSYPTLPCLTLPCPTLPYLTLLSARLETASKQYGVAVLISQMVYELMSDEAKELCRRIDKVAMMLMLILILTLSDTNTN